MLYSINVLIILNFEAFRCHYYPWIKPYTLGKLGTKSVQCVFLGYSTSQSAYLCLDPKTYKNLHSRRVKFCEGIFPFKNQVSTESTSSTNTTFELQEIVSLVPQIKVSEVTPTTCIPNASNSIIDIISTSLPIQNTTPHATYPFNNKDTNQRHLCLHP